MTFSSHVTIQNVSSGAIINFGNCARIAPTIINREIAGAGEDNAAPADVLLDIQESLPVPTPSID
ncbi:spore germination protein [Priestia endophytica]|uniref:spore germination protein n=1 Tax=Priestia endophytica TaxID=135735 RepID=UPI0022817CC7|nr:spore germination protein [Priestia endophytica]MCY8235019.1 spore germination protein [Priestia endophytica]